MYYVYVIKSQATDWLYIGYSENLRRRFAEHQKGLSTATKPYRPFALVFYEAYRAKRDAKRRELYLKSDKGQRTLKLMLQESLSM